MTKKTKYLNYQSFGFTMAEILLSLTIIGVVATITLPSLTGNINERTWTTQRKALYARFSQAIALMPSINGYGVGATNTDTINKAAETFITNGLSKVLKINNICSPDDARFDCGFASKIITTNGVKLDLPANVSGLHPAVPGGTYNIKDTKTAAFETANGESILTFYNPNCTASNVTTSAVSANGTPGYLAKQHVCANFVYDLNGKKGPNTVGKDIGAITVIYSSDSNVVMPMYPKTLTGTKTYELAANECKNLEGGQYRLPNIEEVLSIYYNAGLYGGISNVFGSSDFIWSGTAIDSDNVYGFGHSYGVKYILPKANPYGIVCVQR